MKYFTAIIISLMILVGMIAFILCPKNDFSVNENRKLQSFPKFSIDNVIDGKFTNELSSYLSDNFPLRDKFISLKTKVEKNILNEKLINNIYICKDDYRIEKYNKPENTDNIIRILNEFANNANIKADLMLVPTASNIYTDKLPAFAISTEQIDTMNSMYDNINMNKIDVYTTLLNNKDKQQLYYKLDHHWTTDGAYLAYLEYCNNKGITPQEKNQFYVKTVSNDFKGTIYSKLNDYSLGGDSIDVYDQNLDIDVLYDNVYSNSLYEPKYLKEKDKYSYFLNNLHSYIEITNNNIDNNKQLVVIKDSYANCFVPFLVNHYKKIYVFDPRSYKKSISEFCNSKKIDNILVLYNMNTIDTDTGIKSVY